MNENLKIAFIGTGNIAEFHAPAFKNVGFEIISCSSSLNSKSAQRFSEKFSIPNVYNDTNDLIKNHQEYDAFLIAVSVEPTLEILKECIKTKKPILVEKPISTDINKLESLDNNINNVRVAYNRRFYRTIQYAKNFIELNNPCHLYMQLPDSIDFSFDKNQDFFSVKENSVHGFDILNYLIPNLKLYNIEKYEQPNISFGKKAFLKSDRGDKAEIILNWNSPSNFSLLIDALPYRLEIKPFEKFKLFKGMKVIEPTKDYPLRQYVPKLVEEGTVFSRRDDFLFKPGFLEQALEFKKVVLGNEPNISAGIKDAKRASLLAHNIVK